MKNKYQFAASPSSLRGAVIRNKMVNRHKEIKEIEEQPDPEDDAPVEQSQKPKLKEPAKLLGSVVNRTMVAKLAMILLTEPK